MILMSPESIPLDNYSTEELKILQSRIAKLLPEPIKDLDLYQELINQYTRIRDDDTPQGTNAATALLKQLIEQKVAVYDAQMVQRMERATRNLLKNYDIEEQEEFWRQFEMLT